MTRKNGFEEKKDGIKTEEIMRIKAIAGEGLTKVIASV